jgi:hypothetical protein
MVGPPARGTATNDYEFFCLGRKIEVLLFPVGWIIVPAVKISCIFCDFEDRTGV